MEHGKPSSSAFPCVKSAIEAQFRQVFGATRNQSKAPYMDSQPCDLRIQILTTAPPLQLFISTTRCSQPAHAGAAALQVELESSRHPCLGGCTARGQLSSDRRFSKTCATTILPAAKDGASPVS